MRSLVLRDASRDTTPAQQVRFVARVLREAFALLASAPLDLLLVVVGLYLLGALLALDPELLLLSLVPDFVAAGILTAGLLGRPAARGARASIAQLGPRISVLVAQTLLVLLMIIPLAVVAGLLSFVLIAVVGPALGVSFEDLPTTNPLDPPPGAEALGLIFLAMLGLVFLPVFGRLIPSQAIVLEEDLGPTESLRRSWAMTRGRTIATAMLSLLAFVPGLLLSFVLPVGTVTLLATLPAILFVAVGVAVYRELAARAAPAPPSAA